MIGKNSLPLSTTSFKSLVNQPCTIFLNKRSIWCNFLRWKFLHDDTLVQTRETFVFYLHLLGRHNLLFNQQVSLLASWYIEIRASFWIVLRSCKTIENSNDIKWSRLDKKFILFYIYWYIDTELHEWYFVVFVNSNYIHNRLQPWFLYDQKICNQACN